MDFIVEQASGAGQVRARAMFGEYGLYCDDKIVALICDDKVFLKPTSAGRELLGDVKEAKPYPSANPRFLVPEADWDDADRMAALFRVTAAELPASKPKRKKGHVD